VLFEGSPRAVDEQARALGGDEVDEWDALRRLQASLPGRLRWDGDPAQLVRPGRRIAYVDEPTEARWSELAERVVETLCNRS
jgi:hypothetical protein